MNDESGSISNSNTNKQSLDDDTSTATATTDDDDDDEVTAQERQFAHRVWQRLQPIMDSSNTIPLSNAVDSLAKLGLPVHLVSFPSLPFFCSPFFCSNIPSPFVCLFWLPGVATVLFYSFGL